MTGDPANEPRLILCANCGKPLQAHCRRHFDPCCPGHCKSGEQKWRHGDHD